MCVSSPACDTAVYYYPGAMTFIYCAVLRLLPIQAMLGMLLTIVALCLHALAFKGNQSCKGKDHIIVHL